MRKLTDLWFAAYLKMKGYILCDYEITGPHRARFVFDISDEDYKKERMAFFKSDISKIKQITEELKDLVVLPLSLLLLY